MHNDGTLVIDSNKVYRAEFWRYEEALAEMLIKIREAKPFPTHPAALPEGFTILGHSLTDEQRAAVELACGHKYSIILGPAGSGKTTIINAICEVVAGNSRFSSVLCAPTGKAARNLWAKTHREARTIHSALGSRPNEDFLKPVRWEMIRLVAVDEASMMDVGMLSGILKQVSSNPNCRLVMLGDTRQLASVGPSPGNLLSFLAEHTEIPSYTLKENHRQSCGSESLLRNILHFDEIRGVDDLTFDDCFQLVELDDGAAECAITREAATRYLRGESVQVLSPRNASGRLSARELNFRIQDLVNPMDPRKLSIPFYGRHELRDGDRVMVTMNDRLKDVSNGDIGVLHLRKVWLQNGGTRNGEAPKWHISATIEMEDGRHPEWILDKDKRLPNTELAYALTVHKAQGSEYDSVLLAFSQSMGMLRYRNIAYTAISRARKRIIIYGSRAALDVALRSDLSPRNCDLLQKYEKRKEQEAEKTLQSAS